MNIGLFEILWLLQVLECMVVVVVVTGKRANAMERAVCPRHFAILDPRGVNRRLVASFTIQGTGPLTTDEVSDTPYNLPKRLTKAHVSESTGCPGSLLIAA